MNHKCINASPINKEKNLLSQAVSLKKSWNKMTLASGKGQQSQLYQEADIVGAYKIIFYPHQNQVYDVIDVGFILLQLQFSQTSEKIFSAYEMEWEMKREWNEFFSCITAFFFLYNWTLPHNYAIFHRPILLSFLRFVFPGSAFTMYLLLEPYHSPIPYFST